METNTINRHQIENDIVFWKHFWINYVALQNITYFV